MTSENLKKRIYEYDTAIKNGLVHQWSLTWFIYKNTHELIYAQWKINSNCKYLALLYLLCLFCRTALVYELGGVSKYAKIWASVEKSEIWNTKSWLVPLIVRIKYLELIHCGSMEDSPPPRKSR